MDKLRDYKTREYKKKLLGYSIKGIDELRDFSISFITEDKKTEYDKEEYLIKLFEENDDIYISNTNLFYGLNASGKTSILELTNEINRLTSSLSLDRKKLDSKIAHLF